MRTAALRNQLATAAVALTIALTIVLAAGCSSGPEARTNESGAANPATSLPDAAAPATNSDDSPSTPTVVTAAAATSPPSEDASAPTADVSEELDPAADITFTENGGVTIVNPAVPPATSAGGSRFAGVTVELVGELDEAIAMTTRPGSQTVLVGSQDGVITGFEVDARGRVAPTGTVMNLQERTVSDKERGLLGMTFDPTGSWLYVVFTNRQTSANELVAYPVATDGAIDQAAERAIMTVPQPLANHNGGHVAFGPDGYLYYGLGDGGGQNDPEGNGQNLDTPLGALLRIDPTPDAEVPYAIPPDNPWLDRGAPEIWASGLRNPWRFAFDAAGGDLWIADVGQRDREEINFMPAGTGRGANYGWNIREGSLPFRDPAPGNTATLTDPIHEYSHEGDACSITGGVVYRGTAIPSLAGAYLFGDFCTGEIDALVSEGTTTSVRNLDLSVPRTTLSSFGEDPNGEVWILLLSGRILRLAPR